MFADAIRRAAEDASRATLPNVAKELWRAYGAGQVSEAEAEELSALIEARKVVPVAPAAPKKAAGSRPRSNQSLERRRRWAAYGRLPPSLATRFTPGEIAVLAVVADEVCRRGDCRLAVGHIAAVAGVSETLARNALREARALGLVSIEERRVTAWRNDTNVVRIISTDWRGWLKLAKGRPSTAPYRKPAPRGRSAHGASDQGGGCRSVKATITVRDRSVNLEGWNPIGLPAGRVAGT